MNSIRIKKTFICKDVIDYSINESIIEVYTPVAGDVALFEILEIGKHTMIQCESRRNVFIVEGDHMLAAFGNRYATGQFEGYVPDQPTIFNDIISIGGIVGTLKSKNAEFKHIEPTKVRLIGYATDNNGNVINSRYLQTGKIQFTGKIPHQPTVILSAGSSMDSGKTTSAAFLCRGLKMSGKKVAYMKLTGTAYTKDADLAYDLGADVTLDFAELGFPSTYLCSPQEILDIYQTLLWRLENSPVDFLIVELADGLVQPETESMLQSKLFMKTVNAVVLSSSDSLSAFYGIEYLGKLGYTPIALTGRFTMSQLLIREVEAGCRIPVLTIEQLMSGKFTELFIREKAEVRG